MDNAFFKAFNASNAEAERVMGEPWLLLGSAADVHGTEYRAIAIEKVSATNRLAVGGRFTDVTTTIEIRKSVATLSGVAKDRLVRARGEVFRVKEIDGDGDDSLTLLCVPPGAVISRR